jgi:uncharacterized protein
MTVLPITSFVAAVCALGLIALSIPVTLRRLKVGVSDGAGDDAALHRRIRAQGNFIEYTPIALIALGLVEALGAAKWSIIAIGVSLVVGRSCHALGMLCGAMPLRVIGMVGTYSSLLGGALLLFYAGAA